MYMYSYSFSPNEHYTKDSNLLKKASQQTFHSHHKYDRTDFDWHTNKIHYKENFSLSHYPRPNHSE